jgi:hypothetical protein
MQKHIELMEGDSLIVYAVSREPPPPLTPEPVEDLTVLLQIGAVKIYVNEDKSYVCFKSDLSICNDGSGPSHGDATYQPQTAYCNNGKYLNADVDRYIVVPPQVRSMVPGVVMGCKARLTNLDTDASTEAVTGDIGPKTKTREAAYCAAKVVNPLITHNSGDDKHIYFYELFPGVPAVVNGKQYALEPA